MRKYVLWILMCVILLFVSIRTRPVDGATKIIKEQVLLIAAVDATPLDGATAGQTYLAIDRIPLYTVLLAEWCDAVEVNVYSTGADTANDTVLMNIFGYSIDGPARRIYNQTTFTLGTAVSPDSGLYADTASGTDKHVTTVGVTDSADNAIVKVAFDTTGLKYLYFEPETFTGVTNVIVVVRQYGFK